MALAPTDPVPARIGRRRATSRTELQQVAVELFERNGFDETSIEDIAAAVGISKRTFFRYYQSKTDLVWGDFDAQLAHLREFLATAVTHLPTMEAVHQAVLEFNRIDADQEQQHRARLKLILGVPTLLANSTLRFAQWRAVIAEFAAGRLGGGPSDLLPNVIAYCALGASVAGYEQWLREDDLVLADVLDKALGELALGFEHH